MLNNYDGTTIAATIDEGDDPGFRKRLNPLIVERLRLGPAPFIHFPHQVGILRGKRQMMRAAEARSVEISYFGIISRGLALILDARVV